MSYLCNRNRETKIDNNKVPWMSGLVSGLQNRVRRFESARNLLITSKINMQKKVSEKDAFFFCYAARLLSIFIFKTSLVFSIVSLREVILQK